MSKFPEQSVVETLDSISDIVTAVEFGKFILRTKFNGNHLEIARAWKRLSNRFVMHRLHDFKNYKQGENGWAVPGTFSRDVFAHLLVHACADALKPVL